MDRPAASANKSRSQPAPRRGGRQVIPRPAHARPGEPAPWAGLDPARRRRIGIERVRAALRAGFERAGSGEHVAPEGIPDPGAPSAVLVALFEEHGDTRVVLTRRAAHLRTHTGEIAFPGGRLDPGETPESAALREAAEEIGLDTAAVETIGRLSPLSTFSSRTTITPVVGLLARRPELRTNPNEVERVFDVALSQLASDGLFREERWDLRSGHPFPVWFFELDEDTIWGATARMLVELIRLVLDV